MMRRRASLWPPIGFSMRLPPGRRFRLRGLLVGAVVALVTAAALVICLERQATYLQRQQTAHILQQVCERTAAVLADRMRHHFHAAVLETIEGTGHPQLVEHDLPIVAGLFASGLKRHPYIDRFFLWSARRPSPLSDQVLFYTSQLADMRPVIPVQAPDGQSIGWLVSDAELGREILRLARAYSGQRTFVVLERTIGAVPYQIIIHLLWTDEHRRDIFGILGYTVNLANLRHEMFHELLGGELEQITDTDPNAPELVFSLLDETGRVVYGGEPIPGAAAASVPVEMLFFPGEPLQAWAAELPRVPVWRVMVTTAPPASIARFNGLLAGGVILLIAVAVFCAVVVNWQAIRLSQMQSDFVTNVSHQLRTPVSLLSAATQTLDLERVRSPEKLKEYIDIIRSQTTRLAGLMDRILQFSRLDAGSTNGYELEVTDLRPLVSSIIERFQSDLLRRDVSIRFEADPRVSPVLADADAVEQVLINLLENAVKYGDQRNEIGVKLESTARETIIAVRDAGHGIAKEDLPHVFEKFYRGRDGHRPHGFGLGLAIAQAIIEAHGGRITAESDLGRGSEFRVYIPSVEVEKEERDAASNSDR